MGYLNEVGPSDCEEILRESIRMSIQEKVDPDIYEYGMVSDYWDQAVTDYCEVDHSVAGDFFAKRISAVAVERDNPALQQVIDKAALDAEALAQEQKMNYGQLSDSGELNKPAYEVIPESLPYNELDLLFSVDNGPFQSFHQISDLIDERDVEDW